MTRQPEEMVVRLSEDVEFIRTGCNKLAKSNRESTERLGSLAKLIANSKTEVNHMIGTLERQLLMISSTLSRLEANSFADPSKGKSVSSTSDIPTQEEVVTYGYERDDSASFNSSVIVANDSHLKEVVIAQFASKFQTLSVEEQSNLRKDVAQPFGAPLFMDTPGPSSSVNQIDVTNLSRSQHSSYSGNSTTSPERSEMKHNWGISMDWSCEEQAILEDGLVKYSSERSISSYVKIASELQNKTVRDVAMHCTWISKKENHKRRKKDHSGWGRTRVDNKEIIDLVVASKASYSVPLLCEPAQVLREEDGIINEILTQNEQLLDQIPANFTSSQSTENFILFLQNPRKHESSQKFEGK